MKTNQSITILFGVILSAVSWGLAQAETGWDLRVCSDPNNMPYSNRAEEGFENRVAEILADEMGAQLSYVWYPARQLLIRELFREGQCDLLMGLQDGNPLAITSLPYYQSTYVFVYREDAPFEIDSLDDPDLAKLKIGVQVPPGDGTALPPTEALIAKGYRNFEGFSLAGDYSRPEPARPIIDAVVDGTVDMAVVWGPIGGYFANKASAPLKVVPVTPQVVSVPTFLPMVIPISVAARQGDEDFADLLDRAIAARWDEIQAVLDDYYIPQVRLPKPTL